MVAALRVSASEVMFFVVAAVSSVACDSAESGVVELSAVAPFVALVANCWSSLKSLVGRVLNVRIRHFHVLDSSA